VIDTSALIADPDALLKISDCSIVVPLVAIGVLDRFKRLADLEDRRSRASRQVTRTLDSLAQTQDICAGSRTPSNSTVRISRKHTVINDLASATDNRIVGTALELKKGKDTEVIVISNDGNLRIVAQAYGIRATAYSSQANSSSDGAYRRDKAAPAPVKISGTSPDSASQPSRGSWQYLLFLIVRSLFFS